MAGYSRLFRQIPLQMLRLRAIRAPVHPCPSTSTHLLNLSVEPALPGRHLRTSERPEHFLLFLVNAKSALRKIDLEQFLVRRTASGQPRAASTRNHELASIRALGKFLKKRGVWKNDPTVDIPFAKESRKDPTFLMRGELGQLFEAAANEEDTTRRARNLAIVALLSQLGLRVHELVALNVAQVDIPSRTLLGVSGKGDTRVDLPMSEEVASIVYNWISARAAWAALDEPALFITNESGRPNVDSLRSAAGRDTLVEVQQRQDDYSAFPAPHGRDAVDNAWD